MKREDILISFIHMPTDGKPNQLIDPIRIMKGMFLLRMELGNRLDEFYNFEPYLYGPCSFDIYSDIEKLITQRMIDRVKSDSPHRWDYYRLTQMGDRRANQILQDMDEIREKIKTIKKLVVNFGFMELLQHVYTKYPDYATLSVISIKGVSK